MTDTQEQKPLDRKDLTLMAYKERLTQVEEDNASLRVDVTLLTYQLNDAKKALEEMQSAESVSEGADENFEVEHAEPTE